MDFGKKTTFHAVAVAVVFAAVCVHALLVFPGIPHLSDAADYMDMARSLARGEGFVNRHIYPLSLIFDFARKLPQPDLLWPPLYPLVLSGAFLLLGATDMVALAFNLAAFLAVILLTYLLGRRLYSRTIAFIAALLVALNVLLIGLVIDCMAEMTAVAFFTAAVLAFISARRKAAWFFAGALLGLAILARYQVLLVVPLLPLLLVGGRGLRPEFSRRLLSGVAVYVGLGLLVVILPWAVRNVLAFGNPVFALQSYGEVSKGTVCFDDYYYTYRSLSPQPTLSFMLAHPYCFTRKLAAGGVYFIGHLHETIGWITSVFLVIGLVISVRIAEAGRLRVFTVAAAVVVMIAAVATGPYLRHLAFLVPLAAVQAASGMVWFAERMTSRRRYRTLLLIVVTLLALVPYTLPDQFHEYSAKSEINSRAAEHYDFIGEHFPQGALIASDASDALAWYVGCFSQWLPVDRKSFLAADSLAGIDGIYLQRTAGKTWIEKEYIETGVYQSILDGRFVLVREFPDGALIYKRKGG